MTTNWNPLGKRRKPAAERWTGDNDRPKDKRRTVPGIKRSGGAREVAQMSLNDFAKSYEPTSWGFGGGGEGPEAPAEFQLYEGDHVVLRIPFTEEWEEVVFTLIRFVEREREMVRLLQRRSAGPRDSGATRPPVKRELVLRVAVQLARDGRANDHNFVSAVHSAAMKQLGSGIDGQSVSKRYVRGVLNEALAHQGNLPLAIALATALNSCRYKASEI